MPAHLRVVVEELFDGPTFGDLGSEHLIRAGPRELLNTFHADAIRRHIITVTHDLLKKLDLVGKDLDEFSLDTMKTFRRDAVEAGFRL